MNFLIDPGGLLDEFIKIDPWGQGSFEGGETVEALTKLGEMFSSGTEESLNTFSAGSFVLVLIDLFNYKSKPYIMLLAARALTHSCDVRSFSCIAIVHCVMVSCSVLRLLASEYIYLAKVNVDSSYSVNESDLNKLAAIYTSLFYHKDYYSSADFLEVYLRGLSSALPEYISFDYCDWLL